MIDSRTIARALPAGAFCIVPIAMDIAWSFNGFMVLMAACFVWGALTGPRND